MTSPWPNAETTPLAGPPPGAPMVKRSRHYQQACPVCRATGRDPESSLPGITCPHCGGSRIVWAVEYEYDR